MVFERDSRYGNLLRVGKILASYTIDLKRLPLIKCRSYVNFIIFILPSLLNQNSLFVYLFINLFLEKIIEFLFKKENVKNLFLDLTGLIHVPMYPQMQ